MRNPLPLAALLYTAGVIIGNSWPAPLSWLLIASSALAMLSAACASLRLPALLLLLPLAGWTNLMALTAVVSPFDLRLIFANRIEIVRLRGTLCEVPVYRESERNGRKTGHCIVQVRVDSWSGKGGGWKPAYGCVAVSTLGQLDDRFFTGQGVEFAGVVQPPTGPSAPGQFDYQRYLAYNGIYYQVRVAGTNDWHVMPLAAQLQLGPPFCDRFNAWAQQVMARGLPVEDESLRLLWAMVLGWKTALTQEVAEPFMQSGTLHIFAISGLHIALISGILISVLRVARVPRSVCGVAVIPLIWFYTLATGWQASAIRSTVMMTVVIVGWTLERPAHLLNSLAAAGLVILMMDPRQLFQAGFQLSFFVVLGLALIVPPLEHARQRLLQPDPLVPPELRPRWKRWLDVPIRLLTTSLATSLAAWLGSMPLIAYYFSMVTPGSLLANLVIVPLSGVALMSSLGSLACGTWFPYPAELFNHSSWLWMRLMIGLSEWFASLPGAFFYVRPPGMAAFFAYYLILGGLLSGVFFKPRWRSVAMLGVVLTLGARLFHWHVERERIRITALPIRAGAVFIDEAGSEHDLLVDCGDEATARSLVKPFLKSQGINYLGALLLTHGDIQHVGGAQLISGEFRVPQILTSPLRFRSPAYREILVKLEPTPQRWHRVQRGSQIGPWTVLHPAPEDKFPQAADGALVLRGSFFGTRVLLISKLGRVGQRKLLEREANLGADILIGAVTPAMETLSDAFLEEVRPRILILAGAQFAISNRQNRELRQRLARLKIPVLFTSEIGAAILILDQRGWFIQTTCGQPVPLPFASAPVAPEPAARMDEEETSTPPAPNETGEH